MSTLTLNDYKAPKALGLLALFILVVLGVGSFIGTQTAPGAWYEGLDKPFFNPPNWVFGPVWSTLYVLIAIAGWRTFLDDRGGLAMKLWVAQMVLNWIWSPVFFGAENLVLAFGIILVMLATIIAYIVVVSRRDRLSALLFVPYAAWVGFASILNLSLWILN
ncbi:tryptophan-rich sensory protein [Arsenicitalea aurantiaca]|uniref:Tryptophan-rich sensory protein n=1 Tax=Arsenicitalea aurantiaca TaxID=1783274 RepID=A0A433X3B7_9HYPH|nr:TspO/MBR family protein [Arsenicitalea aurantiaca]RUT28554.1 tryptophan-rich sensory protein [Arsenicitalea aurantiaca]